MATWINFLVQAALGIDTTAQAALATDVEQAVVYSVKGMMCLAHGEVVRAVVSEIEVLSFDENLTPQGIDTIKLNFDKEELHLRGQFDRLVIENNLERVGFLVYFEPDIACEV